MGSLSTAAIIVLAGVSCLTVSQESRMVVPQVQSEDAPGDSGNGATFSPKEILIPVRTGRSFDEIATSDVLTPRCKQTCEPPSFLDSKSCKCVAEGRRP